VTGFLVDTNVISELVKPKPEPRVVAWVDAADEALLFLSVLTLGEIRKGISTVQESRRRGNLESWLETALRPRFAGRVLAVDEDVADRWGRIAADAAQRRKPLPVIDALLAATALHHDLMLVTRNVADVAATGVAVLNPWDF